MKKYVTYKKQQGIATVLIILLVGVALSASTLGVIYTVRSSQDKQVTSHATTNAQAAAWALAEAARIYLSSNSGRTILSALEASGGSQKLNLDLTRLPHLSESTIFVNKAYAQSSKLYADISVNALDSVSQSTSALNIVFEFSPPGTPGNCNDPLGSQFTGRTVGDSLAMRFDGAYPNIVVDGSYGNDTKGAALTGVKTIKVTGDIHLQGTGVDSTIDLVHANGDITLNQAGRFLLAKAGRDLIIKTDLKSLSTGIAAGNISWHNHTNVTSLQSGVPSLLDAQLAGVPEIRSDREGTATFTKINALGTLNARGDVKFLNNDTGDAGTVYSRGNISFSDPEPFKSLISPKEINCAGGKGEQVIGNTVINCSTTTGSPQVNTAAATQAIPKQDTYTPVELKRSLIADADSPSYMPDINYFFQYDATNDMLLVTIKNVNGIPDGKYELFNDHTVSPKLNNAIRPIGTTGVPINPISLCDVNGDLNQCITFTKNVRHLTAANEFVPKFNGAPITYNPLSGSINEYGVIEIAPPPGIWAISQNAKSIPPGVMYFDRDLRISQLSSATPVNSFLSAGDINIAGSAGTMFAPNGVPASVICGNKKPTASLNSTTKQVTVTATGDVLFPLQNGKYLYPKNFCDENGNKVRIGGDPNDANNNGKLPFIGEFSLLAGQENDPEVDGNPNTYQGGDIYTQVSSTVYGRIIAGNTVELVSGTNINVYGTIGSEARADGLSAAENNLNGTINVHTSYLDNLESDSATNDTTKDSNCSPSDDASPGASAPSRMIWSRHI